MPSNFIGLEKQIVCAYMITLACCCVARVDQRVLVYRYDVLSTQVPMLFAFECSPTGSEVVCS